MGAAMEYTIRLFESGTLVIPKAILQQLGWHAGQDLRLIDCGNALQLVPVSQEQKLMPDAGTHEPAIGPDQVTLEDLFGMARGADPSAYRDRNDRY